MDLPVRFWINRTIMEDNNTDSTERVCSTDLSHLKSYVMDEESDYEATNNDQSSQIELLYTITYKIITPVLISLAILTNLMNVFMLWSVRKRQKQKKRQDMATTSCYLMWLAITDLLASVSIIPSLIHSDRSELPYGWAFYYAHLEILLMNALTSASVYIVVGMSVDRFIAVCFPRRYRSVNAMRLAIFRIALSLVVPVLIYIPHCFYQVVVCSESGMAWTYKGDDVLTTLRAWYIWEIVVELCHRMVPATILTILNLCIIITFKKVIAQTKNTIKANREDTKRNQREKHLVYLLCAVVSTFLMTNLPAAVLALTDTAGGSYESFHYEVFRAVANCLEVLGFSLNFVLYFFFVNGMKQVLIEALYFVPNKICGVAPSVSGYQLNSCSEKIGSTGNNLEDV